MPAFNPFKAGPPRDPAQRPAHAELNAHNIPLAQGSLECAVRFAPSP